jgi:hypothetical protein
MKLDLNWRNGNFKIVFVFLDIASCDVESYIHTDPALSGTVKKIATNGLFNANSAEEIMPAFVGKLTLYLKLLSFVKD